MEFFYDRPDAVVDAGLDALCADAGLVRSTPDTAGVRIVARADWDRRLGQVALVSGGGAGHEPSHAGYVGSGMLTAAISGEVFASPSVEAVLAGIRHVSGEAGCLLIIKNYTGDRLNFGLAAERAAGEGHRVASVIIADDIALPQVAQPRGIAGTVLVHKIAGACAARGDELETVATAAQRVADELCSLGLSLDACQVPGQAAQSRQPELGLGIHNEPGAQQVNPRNASEAMGQVLAPLTAEFERRFGADMPMIVMLNDLGGCAPQELAVLTRALIDGLGVARIERLVRPARLMTSMNMHGFSVTLLPARTDYVQALDEPASPAAWPGAFKPAPVAHFEPHLSVNYESAGMRDEAIEARIGAVLDTLSQAREALDALDAQSGDGDTGSTFASGATAVRKLLDDGLLSSADHARLCGQLGRTLAQSMGGSSGVLLSILFTAAGVALDEGRLWPEALAQGVSRMQHYGGAKRGDRTMLDALVPAVEVLREGGDLAAAAKAAREGADATANITKAGAGRAAYVRAEALDGVIDPGAEAVARVFQTLTRD